MRRALDNGQVAEVLELAAAGYRPAQIACFERVVPQLAPQTVEAFRIGSAVEAAAAMRAVMNMLLAGDLDLSVASRLHRQIAARWRKVRAARTIRLLAALAADPRRSGRLSRATNAAPNP